MSENKSGDDSFRTKAPYFVKQFSKIDGTINEKKDELDDLKVEDSDERVDYLEEYR